MRASLVTLIAATSMALLGSAVLAANVHAGPPPAPSCAVDEYGNCIDDVDPYYEVVATGDDTVSDSGEWYGYGAGNCRTVEKTAWGKDLVGIKVYVWHQRVTWCWRDGAISSVFREHWPEVNVPLWQYDAMVETNCNVNDNCSGRTGGYSTTVTATAQFHACAIRGWLCQFKYPRLAFTFGVGGWWSNDVSG